MSISFTEAERTLLWDFLGYGPDEPSFLFLGEKEYAPQDYELENLRIRASRYAFPRHDKNVALRQLADGFDERGHYRMADNLRADAASGAENDLVGVWMFVSMFLATWRTGDADGWRREYVSLGTRAEGGDSFLAELYPFVRHTIDFWPPSYSRFLPYRSAAEFHRQVYPLNGPIGRREQLLQQEVVARLRDSSVALCYGTGANDEFWRRYERLFDVIKSTLDGVEDDWHEVAPGRLRVGLCRRGIRVALIGFPWGRSASKRITEEDIPVLIRALRGLGEVGAAAPASDGQ